MSCSSAGQGAEAGLGGGCRAGVKAFQEAGRPLHSGVSGIPGDRSWARARAKAQQKIRPQLPDALSCSLGPRPACRGQTVGDPKTTAAQPSCALSKAGAPLRGKPLSLLRRTAKLLCVPLQSRSWFAWLFSPPSHFSFPTEERGKVWKHWTDSSQGLAEPESLPGQGSGSCVCPGGPSRRPQGRHNFSRLPSSPLREGAWVGHLRGPV